MDSWDLVKPTIFLEIESVGEMVSELDMDMVRDFNALNWDLCFSTFFNNLQLIFIFLLPESRTILLSLILLLYLKFVPTLVLKSHFHKF